MGKKGGGGGMSIILSTVKLILKKQMEQNGTWEKNVWMFLELSIILKLFSNKLNV